MLIEHSTNEGTTRVATATDETPTAKEIAIASGIRAAMLAGIALAVVAVACGFFGHAKAAAMAGLGAFAVPLVSQIAGSTVAVAVGGIAVAIAGTLVVAWYLVERSRKVVEN